jgi:hypothetical protein
MLSNIGFEILIANLPDYENLVAEIYYDGRFFALISHESQQDVFDIETPESGAPELVVHMVDLNGFLQIVRVACQWLQGQ